MQCESPDAISEIIRQLRRRDCLCDKLFRKVTGQMKAGDLTYDEGMEQLRWIESEMEKTSEAIHRLGNHLEKVRTAEK